MVNEYYKRLLKEKLDDFLYGYHPAPVDNVIKNRWLCMFFRVLTASSVVWLSWFLFMDILVTVSVAVGFYLMVFKVEMDKHIFLKYEKQGV